MSTITTAPGFSNSVRIRDLVYRASGIFHQENRLPFLEERCARRMKELKIADLGAYYGILTRSTSRSGEMNLLLNEIAVGETCFFRSQTQMAALQHQVLPSLAAAKQRSLFPHLRLWSAGCSTGEEAYTLAIILMEEASRLRGLTFEVVASDLNERSLERAQEGIYGEYALRNVSPEILRRYFEPMAGTTRFRVRDEVRKHVKFNRVNLLDDSRLVFVRSLDVIFCRNVLIYFDGDSKRRVIQHFHNNLLPHSYLFLGHADSLPGIQDDFQLVHFPGAIAYKKRTVRR